MILQSLNDYYRRKCDDPDPARRLPAFGLEQKEIPFLLEITREGKLVQLKDTRIFNGKKKVAEVFRVPLGVKKSSGVVANLLWDTLEYVLGVDTKGKPERVVEQHAKFVERIKALPPAAQQDAGIRAVLAFLVDLNLAELQAEPAWAQALESNAVTSFRLHGDVNLVCQRPAVVNAALNVVRDPDERLAMCLVTGDEAPVQRLHAAIKGVWGAQTSGANIVSFNAPAFESYGKTDRQGENAPVSCAAAFAYTTALNHLLRKGSNQRIQVGDASAVFWAEKDSVFESDSLRARIEQIAAREPSRLCSLPCRRASWPGLKDRRAFTCWAWRPTLRASASASTTACRCRTWASAFCSISKTWNWCAASVIRNTHPCFAC